MDTGIEPWNRQFELRLWQHGIVFLIACVILVSRAPDAVFHARFWAEDGLAWYADAYNRGGWNALFLPWTGVFQTVPRLGAALALLVPFLWAPLLMNSIQIVSQALLVNFLLASRSSAWGGFWFRALLATVYLALPDCTEIAYGVSPTAWSMTLGAFLLGVAAIPRGWAGRILEAIYLLLAGLTGPACLMILPLSIFLAWKRPDRWRSARCFIFAICSAAQLSALLILDPNGRPNFGFGANPIMLTRILSGNVFLGALLGRNGTAAMAGPGAAAFLICIAVAGLAIVLWCLLKSEVEMKLFLLFAAMLFIVSLVRPTVYPPAGTTAWEMLAGASDIRYWFIPSLAFAWSLCRSARNGNTLLSFVSILFLCTMSLGVVLNWRHPALKDFRFAEYAKAFEAAPPGTVVVIPENPDGWVIRLIKHASH
jgi:hypothetical protein